jgi:hypothetical protein
MQSFRSTFGNVSVTTSIGLVEPACCNHYRKTAQLLRAQPNFLMPRKRQKPLKAGIDLYRKCRYCKAHRSAHFFNRHETACKTPWIIRNEDRQQHFHATLPSEIEPQDQLGGAMDCEEFVEESSMIQLDDNPAVIVNSSDLSQQPNSSE